MRKFIVLISFIPWLLFFLYKCKNTLKDLKNKRVTGEWIKKNILSLFHFDNLILFAIFLFFCKIYKDSDQIYLTKILLFSSINLYLLINQFYEKKYHKTTIGVEDISTILIIIFLSLIPIIFYTITGHYTITYYIMFAYNFANFLIVFLSKIINDALIKRIKKRK